MIRLSAICFSWWLEFQTHEWYTRFSRESAVKMMCFSACAGFNELTVGLVVLCIALVLFRRPLRGIPGPWGFPLFGHLPLLGSTPQQTLTSWSKKYGDLYKLQFGVWPLVVVNGYKSVREALFKQGEIFADRPRFQAFQHYANGVSMSFHPYDASLRLHRKLTSTALKDCILSSACIEQTQDIIRREGLRIIKSWKGRETEEISPSVDITLAIAGILYSVCFGRDALIQNDEEYKEILTNENPSTEEFAAGNHIDLLPWKKFLSMDKSHQKHIDRMCQMTELNRQKYLQHLNDHDDTYILGYMIKESQKLGDKPISAEQLVNTTVEFLSAGTETSSSTLLWALVYMARFPEIQAKVTAEIRGILGTDCLPSLQDRPNLPYTEATILEVMRLTTIVPFALPHCTLKETTLQGHYIPKGTLVYINLWSVNRDPTIWSEPDKFMPERFLVQDNGDKAWALNHQAAGQLMSFGAGKRKCIGATLGKTQVVLLFTMLMQRCQFSVIDANSPPSFEGNFGDVLKPRPFQLSIKVT